MVSSHAGTVGSPPDMVQMADRVLKCSRPWLWTFSGAKTKQSSPNLYQTWPIQRSAITHLSWAVMLKPLPVWFTVGMCIWFGQILNQIRQIQRNLRIFWDELSLPSRSLKQNWVVSETLKLWIFQRIQSPLPYIITFCQDLCISYVMWAVGQVGVACPKWPHGWNREVYQT